MKIKTLLDLSEATVILDVIDFESGLLQDFLTKNKIKTKLTKGYGQMTTRSPGNEVEFSGDKKALEKMIHQFFGDDDLKDLIEEDLGPKEKIIRTYKFGNHVAKMMKQEDNSILVVYEMSKDKSMPKTYGDELKYEFKNANEATKYLESTGWKLDELHEAGQVMGKWYGYEQLFKKGDKEAKVVMSDENHVVVHFSEMFKGAMDEYMEKDFKSVEEAEKFLVKNGWKKDATWNVKTRKWEKVTEEKKPTPPFVSTKLIPFIEKVLKAKNGVKKIGLNSKNYDKYYETFDNGSPKEIKVFKNIGSKQADYGLDFMKIDNVGVIKVEYSDRDVMSVDPYFYEAK